jgi:hypothetical protein
MTKLLTTAAILAALTLPSYAIGSGELTEGVAKLFIYTEDCKGQIKPEWKMMADAWQTAHPREVAASRKATYAQIQSSGLTLDTAMPLVCAVLKNALNKSESF